MTKPIAVQDAQALVGQEVGVSEWILLDQARIDAFAEVTEDDQFIHVDPARAKVTKFGGTIAHGFLTLSMLSKLGFDCALSIKGAVMGINYGFDRVRFVEPVPSGSRIRARFTLSEVRERVPGQVLLRYTVTVEIEGGQRIAAVIEWLTLQVVQ